MRELPTVQSLPSGCSSSTNLLESCSFLCQTKGEESLGICMELWVRAGSDPLTGEQFLCCQNPETIPRENMAFTSAREKPPCTELCFGIYFIHKQRCTYCCSSGSRQTSVPRNTDIALAITPKSAVPLRSHESTLPSPLQSWNMFGISGSFDPKLPAPLPHPPRSRCLPCWASTSAGSAAPVALLKALFGQGSSAERPSFAAWFKTHSR